MSELFEINSTKKKLVRATQPKPHPITVDKNSRFFIALCKDENSSHSFICLGVELSNEQGRFSNKILCGFGKVIKMNKPTESFIGKLQNIIFYLYSLFTTFPGYLHNEQIFTFDENWQQRKINDEIPASWKAVHMDLSYQAYSLSYQNYLQFLAYLQQKQPGLRAYIPDFNSENDNKITLKWNAISAFDTESKDINYNSIGKAEDYNKISINDSCRQSAIHLTRQACQSERVARKVSSFYWNNLSLKTWLFEGHLGDIYNKLLILPPRPEMYTCMTAKKLAVITKIYNRLEDMILIKENNEKEQATLKKFEVIRALYEKITKDEKQDLSSFFQEISACFNDHKEIIKKHRRYDFFGTETSTEKMFNELSIMALESNKPT